MIRTYQDVSGSLGYEMMYNSSILFNHDIHCDMEIQ